SLQIRADWYHSKYHLPIAITEAAWMGDGFMPFDSLWLDVYGSARYMFKILDMDKTPNNVLLNVIWKLDKIIPIPKNSRNPIPPPLDYKYDVTRFFGDYFANATNQNVSGPTGTYNASSINSDGHGVLLVLNPNDSPIACKAVLVNGFYRP